MPTWAMKILGGAGVLAFAVVALILFGNSRFHSGELAERVEWTKVGTAMVTNQAAQQRSDFIRYQQAADALDARRQALRPIVEHSTEVVHDYAQTDAGRQPCLAADRVRGIEATAAALGFPITPADVGAGAVQPDVTAGPRPQ